jgi:8-oxo-dGTP pyrophosphatase MutT (NUDIX family)
MSIPTAVPGLLTRREAFLARVIERLGAHPSDFQETIRQIATAQKTALFRRAAGVLLPLVFRESSPERLSDEGEFYFQLIKRSSHVPQPGDLSFPGGMLHPLVDGLLRFLLIYGPFPILRGAARRYAAARDREAFRIITLFLTNALRESWEEIRLSPCHVSFLGPLPTYSLTLFQRTIFPLAGFIENPGLLRPNGEVEKILEIPLTSFYRDELIGCYAIEAADQSKPGEPRSLQFPYLIHRDVTGREEILWGATFNITIRFLEIVMDYHLPEWREGRIIRRTLHSDYLTGRPSSSFFP